MTDGATASPVPPTPAAAAIRRLKRRPDFLAAAKGRRFHTDRMTAQARLRGPDEMRDGAPAQGCHVGLTVTKRVGHATERNRIKRRLRRAVEAAADAGASLRADVVLIARRPALDAPFVSLVADLRRAFAMLAKPAGPKPRRGGGNDTAADGRDPADAPAPPPTPSQITIPHGSTDG